MKQLSEINLRHLLQTRRYALAAAGVAVISVLLVMMVILPQVQAILSLQDTITQEKKKAAQLHAKLQTLTEGETLNLIENAPLVEEALPSQKPLLPVISMLNGSAQVAQTQITEVKLAPGIISTGSAQTASSSRTSKTSGARFDALEIELVVEGPLSGVNTFLDTVENAMPLANVTKITLDTSRETTRTATQSAQYKAEITLTAYYFTQSIKAAVDAPLTQVKPEEQALIEKLKQFNRFTPMSQKEVTGGGSEDLFKLDEPTTSL